MIKIYDTNHSFVDMIYKEDISNYYVEWSLEDGLRTISFSLPIVDRYLTNINEEYYIETEDYEYIVKRIVLQEDDPHMIIQGIGNIEELTGTVLEVLDAFDITVNECLTKIVTLKGLSWELQFNVNYANKVQYALSKKTVLECLNQVKEDYALEFWFNTKDKIIEVYAAGGMGRNKGSALMNELRLASLYHSGNTSDFVTVLYPYGYNGLSIKDINNGKEFIENYDYCDKRIVGYYFADDIKYAEILKMKAEEELAKRSCPYIQAKIRASALPQDIQIGDTIFIIDKLKRKKMTKRVVSIKRFPYEPEKDTIELDNPIIPFTEEMWRFKTDYDKNIHYIKENIAQLM